MLLCESRGSCWDFLSVPSDQQPMRVLETREASPKLPVCRALLTSAVPSRDSRDCLRLCCQNPTDGGLRNSTHSFSKVWTLEAQDQGAG